MKKISFVRSSSFIVGVLFTSLLAVGVLFVSYFVVIAEDEALLKESEAALKAEAELYSQLYLHGGITVVKSVLYQAINSPENDYFFLLKHTDGNVWLKNIPGWPAEFETYKQDFILFEINEETMPEMESSARLGSKHLDILAMTIPMDDEAVLLVGRNIDELEIAQWLSGTFGWLMILILLSIALLSFLIAFYVVNRINRMTSIVNQIMNTGNLSSRLEVDSSWDDLSMLSIELNRMLATLEDMVSSVKSVSDNIAHDLRTPLTRLRGKLELAKDIGEKHNLLAEVDNILSIFNGLLRIADIETEKQKSAFRLNDISKIVQDVISLYEALAEDKSQIIETDIDSVSLVSDRDLLFQAFANILDNAIKFTPAGGSIVVCLKIQESNVIFSVCDSGPGIDPQHIESLTRRFFRVQSSRTEPGNGLGLSLVEAVAKLHRATLCFEPNHGGTPPPKGLCCRFQLHK